MRWRRFAWGCSLAGLALATLVACTPDDAAAETSSGNITAYNHTADYVHQFYVNGKWGGNSFAYGGGGKFVCCAQYPTQWRPGLSATVRWTTSSSDPKATGDAAQEHWHEKVVPIEPYKEPGGMNVHFLPEGQVRLIVSGKSAGRPDYPGPDYPKKPPGWPPWEQAAAQPAAPTRDPASRGAPLHDEAPLAWPESLPRPSSAPRAP